MYYKYAYQFAWGLCLMGLLSCSASSIADPDSEEGQAHFSSSAAASDAKSSSSGGGASSSSLALSSGGQTSSSSLGSSSSYTASSSSEEEILVDPRETPVRSYKTVRIGGKVWMAENLNYGSRVNAATGALDGTKAEKYCYGDVDAACTSHGALYTWAEAMALPASCNSSACAGSVLPVHQGICPSGWHVPKESDWDNLAAVLGGLAAAGAQMKASHTGYGNWDAQENGGNQAGFSALPTGYFGSAASGFAGEGSSSIFITAVEDAGSPALAPSQRRLQYNTASLEVWAAAKSDGNALRCVKN